MRDTEKTVREDGLWFQGQQGEKDAFLIVVAFAISLNLVFPSRLGLCYLIPVLLWWP